LVEKEAKAAAKGAEEVSESGPISEAREVVAG
jgi:hypothetical protein